MSQREFDELVRQHAQAWLNVGQSDPGLVVDPALGFHLSLARELSKSLKEAYAKQLALPTSIQEALNSGDGTYRP